MPPVVQTAGALPVRPEPPPEQTRARLRSEPLPAPQL